MRHQVKHQKRYSISRSNHVLFCLLYKQADNDIPLTFQRFPKILKNCGKATRAVPNIFEKFLKITEDFRKPKIAETFHEICDDYSNTFKYRLCNYGNGTLQSLVKMICYFRV